ncbi:hypothetical protein CKA32_004661 [Geitlerinema sp. FC II]|nr:hypothetical protein CKA32_004661 [Geitlerinema sp. FC II]
MGKDFKPICISAPTSRVPRLSKPLRSPLPIRSPPGKDGVSIVEGCWRICRWRSDLSLQNKLIRN